MGTKELIEIIEAHGRIKTSDLVAEVIRRQPAFKHFSYLGLARAIAKALRTHGIRPKPLRLGGNDGFHGKGYEANGYVSVAVFKDWHPFHRFT